MSHLGREAMRRILSGEVGPQEVETVAEHLVSCDSCRALAGELRAENPELQGEGPLPLVFALIDQERRWAVDYLAAVAEWAELRRLPSRRSQRDRVRMTKACHSIAFFHLVLGELKETPSWEEAEFLAGLALLCIEAMSQRQRIAQAADHDLKAQLWTAVANSRRRAAEWERAHQALTNAERHREQGTGDPLLEAGLLSITASTLADQGHLARALEALDRCKVIYRDRSEWALLARTLVQTASVVADSEPAQGLEALDAALPLLPPDDSYLRLLAELLRVECLIGVSRPNEALQVYRRCSRLLNANPRIRMQIRGRFTGAKLLDALEYKLPAERLFDEVIERDIEHELYKDAFLDLLYVYERHVKAGEIEKAARVCRRALTDATLSAVAHDQMRALWEQLLAATGRRAIGHEVLSDL
ncbi:MAG TPA: hypothetical protein VNW71_20865, partial [Thermoanaerobaculia bacterium]|nr:hypothetical protein [Thermoanaerobaculia bacterium]